jgi:hypothetical protein
MLMQHPSPHETYPMDVDTKDPIDLTQRPKGY